MVLTEVGFQDRKDCFVELVSYDSVTTFVDDVLLHQANKFPRKGA